MDQELNLKLDLYYEKFDDAFPMMEYNLNKKDAIKFIDKCLKKNKKAQEIAPLDENVMY